MTNRINISNEYRDKFYRLPKVFFTNDKYTNMSNNAKMAWAILRDRVDLSAKNNWIDKNGDIYFIYTNKNLMDILNIKSTATVTKVKTELIEAELLEQERQGLNKPNKLYLLNPKVSKDDIYKIKEKESNLDNEVKTVDNTGSLKNELPFSESRSLKNELLNVQKMNTNDTELNDTDIRYKDNKDHEQNFMNNHFNQSLKNNNQEMDQLLIKSYIENNSLIQKYSHNLLNLLVVNAQGNIKHFKENIDVIEGAINTIDKSEKVPLEIQLYEENEFAKEFKKDLTKTVHNVFFKIRTDKANEIKDPKSYLFISIKTTAENWAINYKNYTKQS